ncbi:hypothetical protein PR048_002787 [Dryococelus australis]|uniref:Uncharacterized protein n=1 Tax=Dryococelus australis TaxID=614101 RepID=A0ABQ9IM89_9NEOP|nr:hypothetical protein PR048_002787 [Dryococelus australis]
MGRGKREIPEKTRRPAASSGTIPTCENPWNDPRPVCLGERERERARRTLLLTSPGATAGRYARRVVWPSRDELVVSRRRRLARSPPTKANRAQSSAGSPDFRKWESCRTMPLVGGFLAISHFPRPFIPAPHHIHFNHPHRLKFTAIGNKTCECRISPYSKRMDRNQTHDLPDTRQWLEYSPPPTWENRARFPAWPLPDFRMWESFRMMSQGSPVSPAPSFRRCSRIISLHLHRLSRPRSEIKVVSSRWRRLAAVCRRPQLAGSEAPLGRQVVCVSALKHANLRTGIIRARNCTIRTQPGLNIGQYLIRGEAPASRRLSRRRAYVCGVHSFRRAYAR